MKQGLRESYDRYLLSNYAHEPIGMFKYLIELWRYKRRYRDDNAIDDI